MNNIINMKKILVLICVAVLTLTCAAQTKKVAILETTATEGNISSSYLMMISSNIETGIVSNPSYEAYTRTQVKALMQEHNFQRSGMVKDEDIRKLGVLAGVDYVLASEAALLEGKQLFVTAKVLNVESGRYDMSDNELMDFNPAAIQTGCRNLAYKLLNGGEAPQRTISRSTNPVSNSDYEATPISGRNVGLLQPNKDIAVKEGLVAYWTFDGENGEDA